MSLTTDEQQQERLDSWFMQEYNRNYENFVKKIAAKVLGREATLEDAKDFAFVTKESQTFIAYKKENLGEIITSFSESGVTFTFDPESKLFTV